MTWTAYNSLPALLAQTQEAVGEVTTTTTVEYDFPPETFADGLLLGGFAVVAVVIVWLLLRDAARLAPAARVWLILLRLAVLAGLLVIAINPHRRTQEESFRPSQVVLLVDTSTSMQQPAGDPTASTDPADQEVRWEAVRDLLADSPLIERLRETHVVDLATFDSDLTSGRMRFDKLKEGSVVSGPSSVAGETQSATTTDDGQRTTDKSPDWTTLLEPTGLSTRLGDSLDKLLAETRAETLAGVVVISDGASNVGRDVSAANRRAQKNGVPLFAVGVGGTKPPVNLQVRAAHRPLRRATGRRFRADGPGAIAGIRRMARGTGRHGGCLRHGRIAAADRGRERAGRRRISAGDAGRGRRAGRGRVFSDTDGGRRGRVQHPRPAPPGVPESREDDNRVSRVVNIFDRPTRLLVMAGGPMRDYRFSVNALHRHKSMEVDVWLQTAPVGISQNAHEVLYDFPSSGRSCSATTS